MEGIEDLIEIELSDCVNFYGDWIDENVFSECFLDAFTCLLYWIDMERMVNNKENK